MCFLNKIISVFIGIILFIPLSFADEVISESLGDNLPRTAADTNIHEDKGLGSLPQLPLEVEFENSSNEVASDNELIISLKVNYTEADIFPTIVPLKIIV
ncbi:hypothetical protein [Rickettsia endosymbiont of Cantharis rufa]|uniref:hypothetical protein n=1 Tax=Rickettsia endosymbiont of Cantharis rufa TaxID=3066248 RepID=UPI003133468B